MSEIAFQVDIAADRATVLRALNTHEGLTGWWTTGVDRKDESLFFDFPGVPQPFELRRDQATESTVAWTSIGAFPPHWSGTTITWGQLLTCLKGYAETGTAQPLFTL